MAERTKTRKLLEENHLLKNLHDLGLDNDFSSYDTKAQTTTKIDKLDFIRVKKFLCFKGHHQDSAQSTQAKIQSTDNTKWWPGHGATGTLVHRWWERKMVQPLQKTAW